MSSGFELDSCVRIKRSLAGAITQMLYCGLKLFALVRISSRLGPLDLLYADRGFPA